jgi:hypothetical protein
VVKEPLLLDQTRTTRRLLPACWRSSAQYLLSGAQSLRRIHSGQGAPSNLGKGNGSPPPLLHPYLLLCWLHAPAPDHCKGMK